MHNYPGCNNMIDHRLDRSPCYLLLPSCFSQEVMGIDSAIYRKPDICESSACQNTITISDSNAPMGEYELSISDCVPSTAALSLKQIPLLLICSTLKEMSYRDGKSRNESDNGAPTAD